MIKDSFFYVCWRQYRKSESSPGSLYHVCMTSQIGNSSGRYDDKY